jgi:hypothetical protein
MATGRIPTTANSPLTAKGDLFTFSTGSAKLAVGSNGDTLVADSSATTGLRWQSSSSAGKNAVINGGMDVWQRGTSVVGANNSTTFTADRWNAYRASAGSTFTRQVTGDTTNLPNIQYCLRVARDSGNAGTGNIITAQSVETINAIPFAGQTVTVSWYARKGADYSAASNNLNYEFITGTGTDQTILGTYTGAVTTTGTKTLTTTWQRFSYTVTLAATATEFGLDFYFTPTGTAGAADFFEITGVQVELGSVATTFSRAGGTIQGELAACQRYFYQFANGNDLFVGLGVNLNSTTAFTPVYFPVSMRIAPTLSASSGTNFYVFERSVAQDFFNSFTINRATPTAAFLVNSTEISGTAGAGGLMTTNNASSSIAFSSEL